MRKLFAGLALLLPICALAEIIPAGRRVTWQPGVVGGIPTTWTQFCNVKVSIPGTNIVAAADGTNDDSGALQAAIDLAPQRSIVYLPAGTYVLSNKIAFHYSKAREKVILRGAGPTLTRLIYKGANSANYAVIEVRNTDFGQVFNLSGSTSKGSSNLTFSATGAYVNTYYLLDETNPAELVDNKGNTYLSRDSGARCIAQISKATAVNGTSVTIWPPLYFDLTNSPQALLRIGGDANIGIEDLYVENSYDTSIYTLFFIYSAGCWVKGVESKNTGSDHVYFESCAGCEVRDSYFHDALSYDGGRGYGVHLVRQTSDCLIENNIFVNMRHSMILEGAGAGNVFGYNFSDQTHAGVVGQDWLSHDMVSHGAHPLMNLWEGNVVRRLFFDYVLGSGSHNTVFRNWIVLDNWSGDTHVTNARWGEVAKFNYYENLVGNVCGTNGATGYYELPDYTNNTVVTAFKLGYDYGVFDGVPADTNVEATILRHGNYTFFDGTTHWDPAIADHELPVSLYLAAKPSWWGTNRWPAIGPDQSPVVSRIPAETRYRDGQAAPAEPPAAAGTNGVRVGRNVRVGARVRL